MMKFINVNLKTAYDCDKTMIRNTSKFNSFDGDLFYTFIY